MSLFDVDILISVSRYRYRYSTRLVEFTVPGSVPLGHYYRYTTCKIDTDINQSLSKHDLADILCVVPIYLRRLGFHRASPRRKPDLKVLTVWKYSACSYNQAVCQTPSTPTQPTQLIRMHWNFMSTLL